MPPKKRQKIRRNIQRALDRGETYEPPQWFLDEVQKGKVESVEDEKETKEGDDDDEGGENRWYTEEELAGMSAKDRRAKKRMIKALGLTGPAASGNEGGKGSEVKDGKGEDEKVPTEEELEKMSSKDRRKWKRKLEAIEAERQKVDVTEFREAKKKRIEEEEERGGEEEEDVRKVRWHDVWRRR